MSAAIKTLGGFAIVAVVRAIILVTQPIISAANAAYWIRSRAINAGLWCVRRIP